MAYTPEKKAETIADLALGMGIREAGKKHGVGTTTVKRWYDELAKQNEKEQKGTLGQAREQRFNNAVDKFLQATLNMLLIWAETCSDPAFIREKPSSVNELGQTILDRADRLVDSITGDGSGKNGTNGTAADGAPELPRVVQNNDTE